MICGRGKTCAQAFTQVYSECACGQIVWQSADVLPDGTALAQGARYSSPSTEATIEAWWPA